LVATTPDNADIIAPLIKSFSFINVGNFSKMLSFFRFVGSFMQKREYWIQKDLNVAKNYFLLWIKSSLFFGFCPKKTFLKKYQKSISKLHQKSKRLKRI